MAIAARAVLTRPIGAATVVFVTGPGAASLAGASDRDVAAAIARQADGAEAAESELYRRFAPRVRLFGLKHLGEEMAAQDLAQQVLLVTIERLRAGEVRNLDQIGSFILGTSRMTCGGLRRTERRRSALHAKYESAPPVVDADEPDPFSVAAIGRCLAALSERERAILIQTFYAERAAGDIAAAYGMTAGAVRVARHRALTLMRDCIESRRPV